MLWTPGIRASVVILLKPGKPGKPEDAGKLLQCKDFKESTIDGMLVGLVQLPYSTNGICKLSPMPQGKWEKLRTQQHLH